MKKILFLIFLSFSNLFIFGQNLIENGGFEDGNYSVPEGQDPWEYYSEEPTGFDQSEFFNNDVDKWWVADPSNIFTWPESPDWIPAGIVSDGYCAGHSSYYVRSASLHESIMTELKDGTKLEKGKTYHFRTKVRAAEGWADGIGSFQIVFSTIENGLEVWGFNKKKWQAKSIDVEHSCYWKTIDTYFTVPDDNEHHYEDMKYMVLQYNHEINGEGGASLSLHYDDVYLSQEEECIDIKYIQDREYINESTIVEANIHIYAGSNVSTDIPNGPVIVKNGTEWSTDPSEVIYRAPNITLSNGFEVEEGAYFETQNGECTGDCPEITPYIPGTLDLCDDELTLGESLDQEAGIFYEWQPNQYFSNPTSAVTEFLKPEGNGCFEGILKIRTICDEEESFPFTINYHDAPADIDVFNVLTNAENLEFDVNIVNANSYTIQVINTDDNSVIYENSDGVSCGTIDLSEQISLTPCTHNLCGNIDVSITADNQCFDSQEESLSFSYPQPPNPIIEIDNIVSGDYEFSFDVVNIPDEMEYITFQVFNGANELQCSETIDACDDPNLTEYHFDVESCTCLTYCDNHMVKISMKNRCNDNIAYQTLNWNATSSEIIVPWWPNAITMNNDGINDCLWFEPQGADTYEIFVVNQWGNLMYESTGCVDDIPICLWIPQSNITSAVYFYTVVFSNGCGQSVSNTTFVHVYNFGGMITNPNGEMPRDQMSQEHYENLNLNQIQELEERITLFPNPANESVTIQGIPMPVMVNILDTKGKTLLHEESAMGQIDLLNLASGVYFVQIYIGNRSIMKEFIKQ